MMLKVSNHLLKRARQQKTVKVSVNILWTIGIDSHSSNWIQMQSLSWLEGPKVQLRSKGHQFQTAHLSINAASNQQLRKLVNRILLSLNLKVWVRKEELRFWNGILDKFMIRKSPFVNQSYRKWLFNRNITSKKSTQIWLFTQQLKNSSLL